MYKLREAGESNHGHEKHICEISREEDVLVCI